MEWQPEKMCSTTGDYDLLIEKYKHGYKCGQTGNWKWRVIYSGVVVAQGLAADMDTAQKTAEMNVPLNN
jgi:hypothetical protein